MEPLGAKLGHVGGVTGRQNTVADGGATCLVQRTFRGRCWCHGPQPTCFAVARPLIDISLSQKGSIRQGQMITVQHPQGRFAAAQMKLDNLLWLRGASCHALLQPRAHILRHKDVCFLVVANYLHRFCLTRFWSLFFVTREHRFLGRRFDGEWKRIHIAA